MNSAIRDQFRQLLIHQIAPIFRGGVPLGEQRRYLDDMGNNAALPLGLEVRVRELAGRPSEWLQNPGHSDEHVFLYLHGGGYVMGSCAAYRALAGRLALACGVQAVVLEYRLAPEHPFPAGLDDAVAAYHALLADGHDPRRIVIGGDSAGGGLTLATLLALRDAAAPLPAAAVLLSPFTDLTCSGETLTTRAAVEPWLDPTLFDPLVRLYAGKHDRAQPLLSPLLGDLRGLPPLLTSAITRSCSPTRRASPSEPGPPASASSSRSGPSCGTSSNCSPRSCPRRSARSTRSAHSCAPGSTGSSTPRPDPRSGHR